MEGEQFVHIPDVSELAGQHPDDPGLRIAAEIGLRTFLIIPLRKDDRLLGAITANRREVRPFSDKQIALLQNFAAQAVIAMENARLITETREALEQQTATAEVLGVINTSPGDLAPVFKAMLEKAARLCDAGFGILWRLDGGKVYPAAIHNIPAAYAEFLERDVPQPGPVVPLVRALADRSPVHLSDLAQGESYRMRDPFTVAGVELGGIRTFVLVPLIKDDTGLGGFALYRREVRPFTDKQIALVENFAAQAVIAMENARLITETREALEQQTATAEVLQVINSSPGDLAPVFEAMLEKALNLCDGAFGWLDTFDGERFQTAVLRGVPTAFAEFRTRNPPTYGPGTIPQRLLAGELFVHVVDLIEEDAYRAGEPNRRAAVELGGARTAIVVPLIRERVFLGLICVFRQEVRAFSDKQIALLQNFAAQAVIAMENARLITETREALEQQTATAEVLGVINASPGDLAPVFDVDFGKGAQPLWRGAREFNGLQRREFPRRCDARHAGIVLQPCCASRSPQAAFDTGLLAGERFVHIADMAGP